jgi:hypothetical protein
MPLPIQKHTFQEGINSLARSTLNELFADFDCHGKEKGYILKSKKNAKRDIGISGGRYFFLLNTVVLDNKRLFYLRNPCGQPRFSGSYATLSPQLQEALSARKLFIETPGNFVIGDQEFIEQIGELLIINYLPGNKISTLPFQCENEDEFFLGFEIKYKGLFNLCIVQSERTPAKNKAYYPLIYHVVRLADMKLIGGFKNKESCFGCKNSYLLDKFNEDSVNSKYLIRLKKKERDTVMGSVSYVQLYLVCYSMEAIKFELPIQYECTSGVMQWRRSGKTFYEQRGPGS